MRRKAGTLIPLEVEVIEAAMSLRSMGVAEPHGFLLARTMSDHAGARRLAGYGTLYKALDRLERAGHLDSRWEDPNFAAAESRPRRRLYRVTAAGEVAFADARRSADAATSLDPATRRTAEGEAR
jgi:PadR family transcriptional regulator, regulatory protein PadR